MVLTRRKKQPAAEHKANMISFRATLEDKLLIEQNAADHGATVTEWVRAAALRRQPRARTTVASTDRELWLRLADISETLDYALSVTPFSDEVTNEIKLIKSKFDQTLDGLLGEAKVSEDAR